MPGLVAVAETPAPVVVAVAKVPTPHVPADRDGDGVPDDIDACPDMPGPASNAANTSTGVGASRTVNATFSEPMDPATLGASSFTLMQGATLIPGTVTYASMTATFTPAAALSSNIFTATISKGARSAASATSLAADYTWTFTTGGAPAVTSTDPGNGATGVVIDKQVSANFSRAMDPSTIGATTFTLKQGTTDRRRSELRRHHGQVRADEPPRHQHDL